MKSNLFSSRLTGVWLNATTLFILFGLNLLDDISDFTSILFCLLPIIHFLTLNAIRGKESLSSSINLSLLFMLGYSIVYLQVPYYFLFDIEITKYAPEFLLVDRDKAYYASLLASIGLITFLLFYNINIKSYTDSFKTGGDIIGKNTLSNSKFVFTSIGFIVFFILVMNPEFLFEVGSTLDGASGYLKYLAKLFEILLYSGLVVRNIEEFQENRFSAIDTFKRLAREPIVVLAFLFILVSIFQGNRGPIVSLLLLICLPYLRLFERKKIILIIPAIFCSLFLLNFIQEYRVQSQSGLQGFDLAYEEITSNDDFLSASSTIELAGSFRTLVHAVKNYPDFYEHEYGRLHIFGLVSIVPGGAGFISALLNFSKEEKIKFLGSAYLITYLNQGLNASYGDGTSILVEPYIDFGFLGIVLFMALMGLMLSSLENKFSSEKINLFSFSFYNILFSKSIYLSRSSVLLEVSFAVQVFIALFIILRVFQFFSRSR